LKQLVLGLKQVVLRLKTTCFTLQNISWNKLPDIASADNEYGYFWTEWRFICHFSYTFTVFSPLYTDISEN